MYDDYLEPDGLCESCGLDLEDDPDGDHEDHHRECWSCWRGEAPSASHGMPFADGPVSNGRIPEAFRGDQRFAAAWLAGHRAGWAAAMAEQRRAA